MKRKKTFQITSLNVRGIRKHNKFRKMLHWINDHGGQSGISMLQETHGTVEIENLWKQWSRNEIIFSHGSSNSKGVAIIFGPILDYMICQTIKDNEGRYIIVNCIIQGKECCVINSYLPNVENIKLWF